MGPFEIISARDPVRGYRKIIPSYLKTWNPVYIEQPEMPWDSDAWVKKRGELTYELLNWIDQQGWLPSTDYVYTFEKVNYRIAFVFKEANHALLFKLTWFGR